MATAIASAGNETTTTAVNDLPPPFTELTLRDNDTDSNDDDYLYSRLKQEAFEALESEPELQMLFDQTVLSPSVKSFPDAVAITITHRLLSGSASSSLFSLSTLKTMFIDALNDSDYLELGHYIGEAVREDVLAVLNRDAACETILEVVLFFKGFAALVCHRVARKMWYSGTKPRRSMVSLFLQSQASAIFGVDIHPAAVIGSVVMIDHGTGVVIGETAVVGNGCTLLHGVTLGGTGKQTGNRHPKIGAHVLIGASASILGNIVVGDNAKIGAGSVVLRSVPAHATAVGAPAKIIGRAREPDPASSVDEVLENVSLLHQSKTPKRVDSSLTATTASLSDSSSDNGGGDDTNCMCPFRDLKRLGASAPPNTVTFCTLFKLCHPHDIDSFDIGQIFFDMDTDMVGYVSMEKCKETFVDLVTRHTSMDKTKAQAILDEYMATRNTTETNNAK